MNQPRLWVLGVSILLASIIFSVFFYGARAAQDTIRVVGSATRSVESDVIKWRVTVSRTTTEANMSRDYPKLQKSVADFIDHLKESGVPETDISQQPISIQQMYGYPEQPVVNYSITQSIFIISHDIPMIEGLALHPEVLFEQGVMLQMSNLEYYVSGLPEIKAAMLAEATKDARKRAQEMAGSMEVGVGKLISLRAGVVQITEPFSTEVSDYGMYSTATKQKDISVTATAVFKIK